MKHFLTFFIFIALSGSLIAQEKDQAPENTIMQQQLLARKIPGLTIEDKVPNACVDCHVNMPDRNFDARVSTMMRGWYKKVEPDLLEKVQAASAQGVTLTGLHPQASITWKDIPSACMTCHSGNIREAPNFASMMHILHLAGGEDNHFLTNDQGECTHCHKFDVKRGRFKIPSGPEK